MLKALIVDDEPLAHTVLLHHLKQHTDIAIVGRCFSATETLQHLAKHHVDLLFLDINMPALSGIDMLKVIAHPPQVIIVSAYSEFAIDGFDLDVADYLLKPVNSQRLSKALDKVRERCQVHNHASKIQVKVGREIHRLDIDSIVYLEAYGNYVKVWTTQTMLLANSTLKQLLEGLPKVDFLQIHKSYVVNKKTLMCLNTDTVTLSGGVNLKVGKSFKLALKRHFSTL